MRQSDSIFRLHLPTLLALLCVAGAGLMALGDSGVAKDEIHGVETITRNFELLKNGTPIAPPFKYDGTLVNFLAEWGFQVYKHAFASAAEADRLERDPEYAIITRIKQKHWWTWIWSLVGYAGVAVCVGVLCGPRAAWVGPLVLAATPRFFGHTLFNFKDVPFAAWFTLCTLAGALAIAAWLEQRAQNSRADWSWAVAVGGLVGILSGIRFGGFVALGLIFITLLWVAWRTHRWPVLLRRWPLALAVLASWYAITLAAYPVLWHDPVSGLFDFLRGMSAYPWNGRVLFDGVYVRAFDLPLSYLPVWFAIALPEWMLVAAPLGLVWLASRRTGATPLQQALVCLLVLQAAAIPVLAVVKGATFYDAIRHFLFVLPVGAVFASVALVAGYRMLGQPWRYAFAAVAMAVAAVPAWDAWHLHPYQYVYFNRLAGGLAHAPGRYETDYWGLSLREATEWVAGRAPDATLVVGGGLYSALAFAPPTMRVFGLEEIQRGTMAKPDPPFYYVARPRWELPARFPHCPRLYTVERAGAGLSVVRYCPPGA